MVKTNERGYRIPKEQATCKFYVEWWEDVVGDGGPRMQMTDCNCDLVLTQEQIDLMDNIKKCDFNCPGFRPMPTFICPTHDIEYTDWCELCHPMGDDEIGQ